MHIPNPLGSYPLLLRHHDLSNPKPGELMFDYDRDDLYYVNKSTHRNQSIAKIIYDQLLSAKLENTHFNICKSSEDVPVDEDIIPEIQNRHINNFYFNIFQKS